MPEPQVAEHTGWLIPILIGAVQGLLFIIYRSMGLRIGKVENSVETCYKKNDKTFVTMREHDAVTEAMVKRMDDMHGDIKTLLKRDHGSREGDK